MKRSLFIITIALFALLALAGKQKSLAADTNLMPEPVEANYTRAIEGRTADILKVLDLTDTNRAAMVHDIIMTQYRLLRAWHDANDAKRKAAQGDTNGAAQIHALLKSLHGEFIAKLSTSLKPEQIEKVKDKMTYGKVQFTFAGYVAQYPDLSDANKEKILELLKQAREEAMDGGSAEEKTAVFQRYKGKINNYLSAQGIHPAKTKAAGRPSPDQ
jgi:hypothetical protein